MSVREAMRPVELYGNGGELALQEINRKKTILANRTAPEIEAQIVEFSLEQPAFGRSRVAKKARLFDLARRGARRLAAPWSRDDEEGEFASERPGYCGAQGTCYR